MAEYYKIPGPLIKDIEKADCLLSSGQSLSPKLLLMYLYGTGIHHKIYSEHFNVQKVSDKLFEEGELIEVSETLKHNLSSEQKQIFTAEEFVESDKSYLFFYKDNIIRVGINEEVFFDSNKKEHCSLSFYFPVDKQCADIDFLEFLNNNSDPKVFILSQEYGDFVFSKFSVSLPKTFDISLNYGKDFVKINEKLIKSLNENHSGLYMFHGPPGTGKSTYIKYLSSVLKKDVIFFPTGLVGNLTNPDIINLLIKKQNCILILEDAEKAIIKREVNSEASLVSSLLNMTDGILGDVLKLNVIVTYNCKRTEIDEALLRKGRLKAEHSFMPLSVDNVNKISKKYNLKIDTKEEMTIADIFNYKKDEELIGNRSSLIDKPAIGFKS